MACHHVFALHDAKEKWQGAPLLESGRKPPSRWRSGGPAAGALSWANVMLAKAQTDRICYIDLFAGPGRYHDGAKSTPLLVLETVIQDKNPRMRDRLVTVFNDKDEANVRSLQKAISELPGIAYTQRSQNENPTLTFAGSCDRCGVDWGGRKAGMRTRLPKRNRSIPTESYVQAPDSVQHPSGVRNEKGHRFPRISIKRVVKTNVM